MVKLGRRTQGRPISSRIVAGLVERVRQGAPGAVQADLAHGDLEQRAVLGHPDRLGRGADEPTPEPVQDPALGQGQPDVQPGLPAEGGQERVGPFDLDDLLDDAGGDRLDVGPVGHLRVGHDGRRVRVDQDDLEPLFPERLARLSARIVELARLADDDRTGAQDQDLLDVGSLRHGRFSHHPQAVGLSAIDRTIGAIPGARSAQLASAVDPKRPSKPGKFHDPSRFRPPRTIPGPSRPGPTREFGDRVSLPTDQLIQTLFTGWMSTCRSSRPRAPLRRPSSG